VERTRFDYLVKSLQAKSSRRQAIGMLGGVAGALAALSGLRGALADTEELLSAQNQFVRNCRSSGGTSKSVGTRVVQCCYQHFCTSCNFNYSPPICKDTLNRGGVEYSPGGGGVLTDQP
jgi:hypothetical protein